MKLAIMQPYLFPYIGYFQLINYVDKFVILDDVNYIVRGWINRNNILVNNQLCPVIVPIEKRSQNKLICKTFISSDNKWKIKLAKTIGLAYKNAPQFNQVYPIVNNIINNPEKNLSLFIVQSLRLLNQFLGINTSVINTSSIYECGHLKGQEKIINICLQEKADYFINPVGGINLYSTEKFEEQNIKLNFIKSIPFQYKQFNDEFVPFLSIIDVMMFNSPDTISEMMNSFEIIQ